MELAWLACTTTVAIAFQVGWLNVTLTNHRNTDALDGVLRGSKKHFIVSPMCPRPFRDSGLPSSFLTLETMVERSLFRTVVLSTYDALQAAEDCLSTS
jgi:hypothetical protein